MKNDFKNYFGLTENFEIKKITNDFIKFKDSSGNFKILLCCFSLFSFFSLKYVYNNYFQKDKKQNIKYRLSIKLHQIKFVFNRNKEQDFLYLFKILTEIPVKYL